ncbi:MAG: ArsR family transcriptional regulator [Candidatus Lokiarchaeota archaeon]|nr:ArsR family transcriptional regulator [Candidatus Lokiarchaeota archaeon]MBD3339439.1 ArsR family transcriptional regulator [Candidatus Lokiarchaeota archaeon]
MSRDIAFQINDLKKEIKSMNKQLFNLQDLVLKIKFQLDLTKNDENEKKFLIEMTSMVDNGLRTFLLNRPKDCAVKNWCTSLVEGGVLKIIHKYINKGPISASRLINHYLKLTYNPKNCVNEECLQNASNIFNSLKHLLNLARIDEEEKQLSLKASTKDLFLLKDLKKGSELVSPLSNDKRIKILTELCKGKQFYNQLEECVGIRGGPFYFHLKKLIESGYVKQISEKGPYNITPTGLKAIKLLVELTAACE